MDQLRDDREFQRVLNLGLHGYTLLPGEALTLAKRALEMHDRYVERGRAVFILTCLAVGEAILLLTI